MKRFSSSCSEYNVFFVYLSMEWEHPKSLCECMWSCWGSFKSTMGRYFWTLHGGKHIMCDLKSTQYKKLVPNALHLGLFSVHILEFEILQTTWKTNTKKHQNASFNGEKLKINSEMFFVSFSSCDLHDFKF